MLCPKGGEMADTVRQTPDGYLTMAEARARLGVSKMTMAKMVRVAGVETYQDPRDARIKLLKTEDVERMARPIPAGKAAA
jgi:DNA-binding MurR/RpiR family transcriptional regulator